MVFNIQRKDLNPSQIKRSNKIMGAALTLIFALFSLISFGSGTTGSIPGPALGVFYIAMIVIAFLYVKKKAAYQLKVADEVSREEISANIVTSRDDIKVWKSFQLLFRVRLSSYRPSKK